MSQMILDYGPVIVGLASVFAAFYINRRALNQRRYDDARKELYKKLNAFYGPLDLQLAASRELYELFVKKFRETDPNYRTLTYLLEGREFQGNEKALFEEVMYITERIEKLIIENAGLIDDDDLRDLLAKATAHYRVLRLAYTQALYGNVERYKEYVYPRDLDEKVREKIRRLKNELDQMNRV